MERSTLYLAAPLFNPGEREYNLQIRRLLEPRFEVYLPQIDGALLPDLISSGLSPDAAARRVFEEDVAAVRRCSKFLIVLNGRTVDEGAAFELGLAWSLGKATYGFKDDFRQTVAGGDNPMIECALISIFRSLDALQEWVSSL
jgi:nucleoside 2-deoxyribosyltransferase